MQSRLNDFLRENNVERPVKGETNQHNFGMRVDGQHRQFVLEVFRCTSFGKTSAKNQTVERRFRFMRFQ